MTLTASARTHAGRVRPHNEDAAVCRPEQGLFAVIDGMGGQEAGEVAAAIAAAALAEVPNLPKLASETVLTAAMKEARARILRQAEADPSQKDMGAVATAVRMEDNGRAIAVAHVGDTRAWLVNARGVRQLTRDHVAEGDAGTKRPVARDLGRRTMDGEWVETGRFPVGRNDLLVLASDGLHDAVPQDELATELTRLWREGADADAVSARLVALALARGGPDNVTVVAVRIGRFHRGGRPRRLNFALTTALFLAITALAVSALFGRRAPPVLALPDRVAVETTFAAPATIQVEAGKTTTIAAGTRLEVRGVRVDGLDWRVEVGEGATLVLDLSAVDLDGLFGVLLAKGATLEMIDTRVSAETIRVFTAEESTVRLRHVTLEAGDAGPAIEGPGAVEEMDVVRRARHAEDVPAAPPEPTGGAPTEGAPTEGAPTAPGVDGTAPGATPANGAAKPTDGATKPANGATKPADAPADAKPAEPTPGAKPANGATKPTGTKPANVPAEGTKR